MSNGCMNKYVNDKLYILVQTFEQLKKSTHNERNTYTKHINDKRKKIMKNRKKKKK